MPRLEELACPLKLTEREANRRFKCGREKNEQIGAVAILSRCNLSPPPLEAAGGWIWRLRLQNDLMAGKFNIYI